ncbi:hypothetical protein [Saccharothrix texasensis]|uniref:Uncharacterized protein n=1 Tax=Saccharothrix texasensis TaxID=103734 RepID=A0A3N1HC00_9PSEU|nr:hypothetical protein [Saccharothrix texasensis]ROP39812.1 hypothetical protein EDD40_5211 [Saccharothrix texasensis]
MSDDNLIHLQVKRSWWDGSALTACGLRVETPEAVWTWFTDLSWCPTCKAADKARRK